jgi:predicted kinase
MRIAVLNYYNPIHAERSPVDNPLNKTPKIKQYNFGKTDVFIGQKATLAHLLAEPATYFKTLSEPEKRECLKHNIHPDDVVGIHGILRKKLTNYDTPQIIEARYKDAIAGSLDVKTLDLSQRTAILSPLSDKIKNTPRENKLILVTGLIGAGKSTFIQSYNLEKNHLLRDADLIRPLCPGFEEHGAKYTHRAVMELISNFSYDALSKGYNIIISTTGYYEFIAALLAGASQAKYNIKLIHIEVSPETAINRAIKRFKEGEIFPNGRLIHRFLDPAYIEGSPYVNDIVKNFKDKVADLLVYNNNNEGFVPAAKFVRGVGTII